MENPTIEQLENKLKILINIRIQGRNWGYEVDSRLANSKLNTGKTSCYRYKSEEQAYFGLIDYLKNNIHDYAEIFR